MSYSVVKKIEIEDLAELKRTMGDTSDDSTIYYYKLGKKLGFVDGVGGALGSNTTVTFWYYRSPLNDGSETISEVILPIVDSRWDDALVFGACYYLTGDLKFKAMHEDEINRMKTIQSIQNDHQYTRKVNRDYD